MTAIRGVRLTRRRLCGLAGGYAAAAVALAVLLVVLGSRAAERTGLHRQVYPEVGFNGAPLLDDASPEITLDFLDNDPALPRRFFSVRWRGFWYVPEPGEFDLYGAGDDRLDFWLDGELVLRRTPPLDMHTQVSSRNFGFQEWSGVGLGMALWARARVGIVTSVTSLERPPGVWLLAPP